MEITQNQLLREGDYADVQRQSLYDDNILYLCCIGALNAWDRIKEVVQKIESFT